MHELSIAMNLIKIIEQTAAQNNMGIVTSVLVRAGELTSVEPETLTFCFDQVKQDTIAAAAELTVEIVPLIARCEKCNSEFRVEELQFYCPHCENKEIKVTQGEEIQLFQLEGEVA